MNTEFKYKVGDLLIRKLPENSRRRDSGDYIKILAAYKSIHDIDDNDYTIEYHNGYINIMIQETAITKAFKPPNSKRELDLARLMFIK